MTIWVDPPLFTRVTQTYDGLIKLKTQMKIEKKQEGRWVGEVEQGKPRS